MMIPALPGFWAIFEEKDSNTELAFPVVAWGNDDAPDDNLYAYIVSDGFIESIKGKTNFKRIDYRIDGLQFKNTCKETSINTGKNVIHIHHTNH
jgi:hypothetical protein